MTEGSSAVGAYNISRTTRKHLTLASRAKIQASLTLIRCLFCEIMDAVICQMTERSSDMKCRFFSRLPDFAAFADFVKQKGFSDAELATLLRGYSH